jgi:hypothetical protein
MPATTLDRVLDEIHAIGQTLEKTQRTNEMLRSVLHAAQQLVDAIHAYGPDSPAYDDAYANIVDALNTYYRA